MDAPDKYTLIFIIVFMMIPVVAISLINNSTGIFYGNPELEVLMTNDTTSKRIVEIPVIISGRFTEGSITYICYLYNPNDKDITASFTYTLRAGLDTSLTTMSCSIGNSFTIESKGEPVQALITFSLLDTVFEGSNEWRIFERAPIEVIELAIVYE